MKTITSRQNPLVRAFRELADAPDLGGRRLLLDGVHLVRDARDAGIRLTAVAISATHVAYCSVRVEPAWMTIGHSAGVAAALTAKGGTDVQQVDYAKLRERLLAQKQVLDLQ